jgi:hypothetical protein
MRTRLVALICATGLFTLVVSTASASAATCTGSPHDASNGSEIDVSCDTAISSGSFQIATNRGTNNSIAAPKIAGGTGGFACSPQFAPGGSQWTSIITCNGSMTAGATAQVLTQFGPNACSSPKFAGQLTVDFTTGVPGFGPAPLAAYPCSGNTGGSSRCDKVVTGRNCDPGGVFMGTVLKPPARASVGQARSGLVFKLKLGVHGRATVTIEVGGKVMGKTSKKVRPGTAKLVAKLSSKAAGQLAGKNTKAWIHVEVAPNASVEGFSTHGREYFKLKLTG